MAVLDAEVERRALVAAKVLAQLGTLQAVYVFGSCIEGRADRWSDIDLAVFLEGIETWDIRRRAQAMTRAQREAGLDIEPQHLSRTTAGQQQPHQHADGGRLPRSIGSQVADHFTGAYLEGHGIYSAKVSKKLRQAVGLNNGFHDDLLERLCISKRQAPGPL